MDKHERPYRCLAEGCEKLPGFTYSGGLLRHEREVHGKHGGPKNPLHCPHTTCKRHTGKGFSRQENLNEHMRRVHTNDGGAAGAGTLEDTTDDAASETAGAAGVTTVTFGGAQSSGGTLSVALKRKRDSTGDDDDGDLRDEIKRVKQENADLRRQMNIMISQIAAMQQTIGPQAQAFLGTATAAM